MKKWSRKKERITGGHGGPNRETNKNKYECENIRKGFQLKPSSMTKKKKEMESMGREVAVRVRGVGIWKIYYFLAYGDYYTIMQNHDYDCNEKN